MDSVQEIKEKLDIVELIREYVPLQPAGRNLKGLCPFHKEKTPSFMVSPERQSWRCFGQCGEGGDIFSFVMKYENVEFYEALRMLAEKAGVELKKSNPASQKEFGVLYDINAEAAQFFQNQLQQNQEAQQYCKQRGISQQTLTDFSIGYAPTNVDDLLLYLVNAGYGVEDIERAGVAFKTQRGTYMDRFRARLMFPLHNTFGKVVGFSGRIIPSHEDEKTAKYINSPETLIYNKSKILYGYNIAKQYIKDERTAVVVEGNMDALMLYQDGVKNTVAISGTAFTPHHLDILSKTADTLTLFFDTDEAGQIATERTIDMASAHDMGVAVVVIEGAKDAAEYIRNNPGSLVSSLSAKTISAFDFYAKRFLQPTENEQEFKRNIRTMLGKVQQLKSPVDKSRWVQKIADRTKISETALMEEMQLVKKPTVQTTTQQPPQKTIEQMLTSRMEKIAFEVLVWALAGNGEGKNQLSEYHMYMPEHFVPIADAIGTGDVGNEDTRIMMDYIQMRASRLPDDAEQAAAELRFLLQELKKEYLKYRRTQLQEQIQSAQKNSNNRESVQSLLKEFDEITKLIDN